MPINYYILETPFQDLENDITDLIDDLENGGRTDAERDLISQLDDLYDDVGSLRTKISDLIGSNHQSNVPQAPVKAPSSAPVKQEPKVTVEPLPASLLPVANQESSWDDMRMTAWIIAGVIILIAVIIFLIALIIR